MYFPSCRRTAHHRCRAVDQLGHDLAQALHVHRGRDVHRAHHVGEQHSHLLVLRRLRRRGRPLCPACRRRIGPLAWQGVRTTHTTPFSRRAPRPSPSGGPTQYRFTLVSDVRQIPAPPWVDRRIAYLTTDQVAKHLPLQSHAGSMIESSADPADKWQLKTVTK